MKSMGGDFTEPESRGKFNQPFRMLHETGAAVYFGSRRPGQPVVVDMSGQICEACGEAGIEWALGCDAWVTRQDVAVDVGPKELARGRLNEMRRTFRRGDVVGRIHRKSFRWNEDDSTGGRTAYFGAPSSPLLLLAYDSRGDLRLEFRHRPQGKLERRQLLVAMKSDGLWPIWRRYARGIVFPMSWYRDLVFAGEAMDVLKDAEIAIALEEAIDTLRQQSGTTIWALMQLGYDLPRLAADPGKGMDPRLAVKLLRWSREAETLGFDGGKLDQEVRCRLKRKRVSK